MSEKRRPLVERKSWAGWFHDDVTDKREPKRTVGFNPAFRDQLSRRETH